MHGFMALQCSAEDAPHYNSMLESIVTMAQTVARSNPYSNIPLCADMSPATPYPGSFTASSGISTRDRTEAPNTFRAWLKLLAAVLARLRAMLVFSFCLLRAANAALL
jgi:hypothetical protein